MFLGFSLLFIFLKEKKNIKLGGEGGSEELGGTGRGKHDQDILYEKNVYD